MDFKEELNKIIRYIEEEAIIQRETRVRLEAMNVEKTATKSTDKP